MGGGWRLQMSHGVNNVLIKYRIFSIKNGDNEEVNLTINKTT